MRLAALAIIACLISQEEKVTLKYSPKQGDRLSHTSKSEVKLTAEINMNGMVQEIEVEQIDKQKIVTDISGVSDGRVTQKVFDIKESYEEKKEPPDMEVKRTDSPLHGRKITASLKDGKAVYEGADGLEKKGLRKIPLEDRAIHIFPATPVAVGDSWQVKDQAVRDFLETDQEVKSAKLDLKLTAVKEVDKRRCAILSASLEMSVDAPNGLTLKMTKMEGEIVVWIERGYILSYKVKGTLKLDGDQGQFSMSGKTDVTLEYALKIE